MYSNFLHKVRCYGLTPLLKMCDKYAMISHHSLHCNTSHTLKNLNLCYPYKYKALIVLNLESKELKVEGTIMT